MRPTLGCCSWSLRPESPRDLAEKLQEIGVEYVQLALEPIRSGAWKLDDTKKALAKIGVSVASGMMSMLGEDYTTLETIRETGGVRPESTWNANLLAARGNALLAKKLGLTLVTFHAGFLPHDVDDPERRILLDRLRVMVDTFAAQGVHVGFETGQETAGTLLDVLRELDRPTAGVNFDPANIILYDMGDPIAALTKLAPYVRQLHMKDARRTKKKGRWGLEVAVGDGEVDWKRLLSVVKQKAIPMQFMFEREAGEDRVEDVKRGIAFVTELLNGRAK